jgi:site-specific recombinase XerD
MAKAQRIRFSDGAHSWTVIGHNCLPAIPIQKFIYYLYQLQRSPNTLKSYAHHLAHFWSFVEHYKLSWKLVTLSNLADFVYWLRKPASNVFAINDSVSKRTDSTINTIIAAVTSFYRFQEELGEGPFFNAYFQSIDHKTPYKPLLHHLNTDQTITRRKIKIKYPRHLPAILTQEQVLEAVHLCQRLRDKFLLLLLYQTGMRIGQALGLFHSDIHSWDNEIYLIPRTNHINSARAKSIHPNIIPVPKQLMGLYSNYVIHELEEIHSDYVFVCLKTQCRGKPLDYYTVQKLFDKLSRKLPFKITPHMLRHTHATELIRSGWDMAYVKKRLGHKDIQTTINTYIHLCTEDIKAALHQYEQRINHAKID